ncbi:MAG: acyltransferase [Clostridia bacterium]|nr:acyltransferase [Clostridia bacterium]
MAEQKPGMIRSLQGLRVLAFIGIFLSHAIDTPSGRWGVSIFIMLSGFVMTYAYWNRNGEEWEKPTLKSAFRFSWRKIRPLYPLHLIMLAAAFIPYYLIPAILSHSMKELAKVFAKLAITVPLVQTWFPVGFEAINTVAWYLSAMLFIYAAFPWVMKYLKKDRGVKKVLPAMLIAFAAQFAFAFVSRYIPFVNNAHWSCYILPLFRFGDFFIGCCLGYCFLKRGDRKLNAGIATALEVLFLALGVGGMLLHDIIDAKWFTFTLVYVPFSAGLVYVLAGSEGLVARLFSTKPFQTAAMLTPFAFLIHRQVLHYCEDLYLFAVGTPIHPVLLIAAAMALTVFFSYAYMVWSKGRRGIKK